MEPKVVKETPTSRLNFDREVRSAKCEVESAALLLRGSYKPRSEVAAL